VVDGLAANRPVILFDNRGVGLSGGEVPADMKAMASDAANFIKALGLIQIDVLGFSMGGFIAQELALAEPTLVRRVILAGTGPQGGQGSIAPEVLAAITVYPDAGANRAMAFFTPSQASQAAARDFIARTQQRVEREPLSSLQAMQAQGAAIGAWGAASNSEYNQRLAQAKQPFLVVNGSNDLIVATVNSVALYQGLPNAQLILYPDSGHGAIFQHHTLFVKHAALFLDSVKAL
jgi:pimeloyl-ACP methyl ester carboxylesterase